MSKGNQKESVVERLLAKHEGQNNATIEALKIAQKRREEKEAEALSQRLEANLGVMENNIQNAVRQLRDIRKAEKMVMKAIEDLNIAEEEFLSDLDTSKYNAFISVLRNTQSFPLRQM